MKPRGPACQPHCPNRGAQLHAPAFGQQPPPLCPYPRPHRCRRFLPTVSAAASLTSTVLCSYKGCTSGLSFPLSASTPFMPHYSLPPHGPPSSTSPVSVSSARSPTQLTHPRAPPRPRAIRQPIVAGQNPPGSNVSKTRGAGKPTLPPMEPRDL
jgi:hypothetical protein